MFLIDLAIFILVLGALVFFHELGHFIAAKACNIYCDRFSLGMPPRLFGIRWGETDYCIGALPIGGYVKMAGQEDAPQTDEKRESEYGHVPPERWFSNRPVWQRIIVILAGPLMNLVLGILAYGLIAGIGAEVPEMMFDNRIGLVVPDSPAATAQLYKVAEGERTIDYSKKPDGIGWQTGDRIVSIGGKKIANISDVTISAILGAGAVAEVAIERVEDDGSITRYLSPVEPKIIGDATHARFGIAPFDTALVKETREGMPAQLGGVRPDDIIERVNGKKIDGPTLTKFLEDKTDGSPVTLGIKRGEERLSIVVTPAVIGRFEGIRFRPEKTETPESEKESRPVVDVVTSEVAKQVDVKPRDVILETDGAPVTMAQLEEAERTRPGQTLTLSVKRPAVLYGLLRRGEVKSLALNVKAVGAVGVTFGDKTVYHRAAPLEIIPEAFGLAYRDVVTTVRIVKVLFTGGLSPRELGGPIMIFQTTKAAAELGYIWLLKTLAFISINLCVVNLLPLPVLDGGLLVLLVLEGIRHKPIDMKLAERIQRVGLALIIALMLFATYNDILRWVQGLLS